MKKKLYILLFFFAVTFQAYPIEMKLSLERINVDFYGVVNSDITAVCYGTGSIILSSNDNGINWKQKCIHDDSIDITQMVYSKDKFFALLTSYYYVIGDKQANNWNSIFTGIYGQQSIEVYEDFVFILGLNELYIFKDNQLQNKINLIDTNKYSELKIFKNQLIVAGDEGKLISLDLVKYEQRLIDFQSLGVCQNCLSLRRIKLDGNNLYLSHGVTVFKTDDLETWTVAAGYTSLYDSYKGKVYDLKALNTQKLMSAKLAFYEAGQQSNNLISLDWEQRNVDILAFIDYKFINDSVIIAVGNDKLIAKSNDGGFYWELISNFKSLGFLSVLNDSIYFSIKDKGRIYRTLNYGLTWLPPLYTDTTMTWFKLPRYSEFHENGFGFIISDDFGNRNNLMVTYDYGNSYTLSINGLSGYFSPDNPSFIKTKSGYNVIFPRGLSKVPLTTLVKIDTSLKFVSWKNIYDSLTIISIKKIHDNEYLGMAIDKHWPHYVDGITLSFNYWFLKSSDDGETWEKQFEIFMGDTSLNGNFYNYENKLLQGATYRYKEVRDTPNVNQLFIIDMLTTERQRLFNDVVSSYSLITQYNDYLIFGGSQYLFVNPRYKEDLSYWEKFSVKGKLISSMYYKDDKLLSYIYDYQGRKSHLYNTTLEFTSDVETQAVIKTYLYSYPPYPNPAVNLVRADIYWDSRFEIDDADIGIFNYAGLKISDKKNITIDKKSNFGGTLVWDCSAYSPGVYFLIIKHGDARRVIPVVVGK